MIGASFCTWSRLSSMLRPFQPVSLARRSRATWRYDDTSAMAAWPNYKFHLTHRKHYHEPHTWGVQKLTRLRCVDNSKIGREAMAEGKPPK